MSNYTRTLRVPSRTNYSTSRGSRTCHTLVQARRSQVFRQSGSQRGTNYPSARSKSWSPSLAVSSRPQRNEHLPKQSPLGGHPPQDDIERTSPTESLDNRPVVYPRLGPRLPCVLERFGLTPADRVDLGWCNPVIHSIPFDFTSSLWVESVKSKRIEVPAGGLVDSFRPQKPWVVMRTDMEHRRRSGERRQVDSRRDVWVFRKCEAEQHERSNRKKMS